MGDLRRRLLAAELSRLQIPRHGALRIAVGYPNTYHVALSSLAYQWVVELAAQVPGIGVERFFADAQIDGRTLESDQPLANFDLLAWSCSFELDASNLLRTMQRAGIPLRREERQEHHPLIVVGGAVASINPLPLAPAVDVFCLGAAELVWHRLLRLAASRPSRERLLETLAEEDGFFVPAHHLDQDGAPLHRVRRLEKRDLQMADPALVPWSHVLTPLTEYSQRGLVEISRGCPEKCRYCWVSHNYGRLRSYSAESIIHRVRELSSLGDRVGLVATAVGDHPELAVILDACRGLDMNVALSSLRIPAMVDEVLRPLAESGGRSVTIAPETGSDALRYALNKPISNDRIVEAVETAQRCGIPDLKMYFIIGLPGETDDDLEAINQLLRRCQQVMAGHGRARGRMGSLTAGVSVLVPKPYTPYGREAMITAAESKRRLRIVEGGLRGVAKLDRPSYREALWQAYLSRGSTASFTILEQAAAGMKLGRLITEHKSEIEARTLQPVHGRAQWLFISSAPRS